MKICSKYSIISRRGAAQNRVNCDDKRPWLFHWRVKVRIQAGDNGLWARVTTGTCPPLVATVEGDFDSGILTIQAYIQTIVVAAHEWDVRDESYKFLPHIEDQLEQAMLLYRQDIGRNRRVLLTTATGKDPEALCMDYPEEDRATIYEMLEAEDREDVEDYLEEAWGAPSLDASIACEAVNTKDRGEAVEDAAEASNADNAEWLRIDKAEWLRILMIGSHSVQGLEHVFESRAVVFPYAGLDVVEAFSISSGSRLALPYLLNRTYGVVGAGDVVAVIEMEEPRICLHSVRKSTAS